MLPINLNEVDVSSGLICSEPMTSRTSFIIPAAPRGVRHRAETDGWLKHEGSGVKDDGLATYDLYWHSQEYVKPR